MPKKTKIYLCLILLVAGITLFILQLFVFEAPDGVSSNIKKFLLDILDLLFFIG